MQIIDAMLSIYLIMQPAASFVGVLEKLSTVDKSATQKWFEQEANKGNANAQYMIGAFHQFGKMYGKIDEDAALDWYDKAANNGHVDALYRFAMLCLNNKTLRINKVAAHHFFSLASERGHLASKAELARLSFHEETNPEERKKLVPKLISDLSPYAKSGNPDIEYLLARLMEEASGLTNDNFALYKSAAEKGHLRANLRLGLYYKQANSSMADINLAANYIYFAAFYGEAEAQYELSQMFADNSISEIKLQIENLPVPVLEGANKLGASVGYPGTGYWLELHPVEHTGPVHRANAWLSRAAHNKNIKAMLAKADADRTKRKDLNADQIADLYKEAALLGSAEAAYQIGMTYLSLAKEDKYLVGAIHWLSRAANDGHVDAMFEIGQIYYRKDLPTHSNIHAFHWFAKAFEKDSWRAAHQLGVLYDTEAKADPNHFQNYSNYFQSNLAKSLDYYRLAKFFGSREWTSRIREIEKIVQDPKKDKTSVEWLIQAAEQGDAAAAFHLAHGHLYGQRKLPETLKKDGATLFDVAMEYLVRSADAGFAPAQYLIYSSLKIESRFSKEYRLEALHKAAENNHMVAQYQLGELYIRGEDVKQDFDRAARLFLKSANSGHGDALMMLSNFQNGIYKSKEIYPDARGAEINKARAYQSGSLLGIISRLNEAENNKNDTDLLLARELLHQYFTVSRHEIASAYTRDNAIKLAKMYQAKDDPKVNIYRAITVLEADVLDFHFDDVEYELAKLYRDSVAIPYTLKIREKVLTHFRRAAREDHHAAQYELGKFLTRIRDAHRIKEGHTWIVVAHLNGYAPAASDHELLKGSLSPNVYNEIYQAAMNCKSGQDIGCYF